MPLPKLNILLVDDDPDDHIITRDLLGECLADRFHLDWMATAATGLHQLRQGRYDICLCDFRLGGVTGLDFIAEARQDAQCPPIIILTGHGDLEVDLAAMRAGADDYLVKSRLDAAMLERSIRYALERRRGAAALRQQLDRISLLNQTVRAVAERQDMASIFQVALAHLEDHLPVAFGAVCVFQPNFKQATLVALGPRSRTLAYGQPVREGLIIPIAGSCLDDCVRGAISQLSTAVPATDFERQLAALGLGPLVALPMTAGESMLAAMLLGRVGAEGFQPAEVEFLRALCEHISLAALHAKLHADLQQAYDQLKASQQSALLQERLAAVGQLAAGVAHEFNNILTVIQGYSSLLLTKASPGEPSHNALRHIMNGADRAARLINQLLSFSRQQMLQPEPVDFNAVVERVVRMLEQVIEEHIQLQLDLAPDLPRLTADPGMLEQIVLNLSINARDAMAGGGTLRISTSVVRLGSDYRAHHPDGRPGRFVCLTVTDTGCGMDAATKARLFEPFFTTKDVGKGTGMGLAAVYGIVQQHKGWIEVDSQPGQGATFRVLLPSFVSSGTRAAEPELSVLPDVSGKTILVVEDEPQLQRLAQEILEQYGYRVLVAASGPEALEIWNRKDTRVDLVLTDMVMPGGMSGEDLGVQLKARQPDLQIIYSSGYSVDFAGRAFEAGQGIRFLPKPYPPQQLLRLIRECLAPVTESSQ